MSNTACYYILGDFNMPYIDWKELSSSNKAGKQFLKFCTNLSLNQKIDKPTFKSGSILDLLLCDDISSALLNSVEILPPLTTTCDHNTITFSLFIENMEKLNTNPGEFFCYQKGNYDAINSELNTINWEHIFSSLDFNIQHIYDHFILIVKTLTNKYIPTSKFKTTVRQPKHITKLAKRKTVLYRKYKLDSSLKNEYKELSLNYDKAVSNWHNTVETRLCESGDTSSFYKYARKKLKNYSSIPPLTTSAQTQVTDHAEKAEIFNEYFQSIFIADDGKSLDLNQRIDSKNFLNTLYIDVESVSAVINNLSSKSSLTPEGIPSIFVKKTGSAIKNFLSMLFNLSIQTNQLPWQWKFSLISPIHKKDSKSLPKNYRPVAQTSVIGRMEEKLLSSHILDHLYTNNLLSTNQHGFLPRRSSSTQLLGALNDWISMRKNSKTVNIIYTDLAKAFDKVSHPKLLEVLKSYGISGDVYNWLQNFLTNRTQSVVVKSHRSNPLPITSGVPQGSVIGPILFLLYIDDISKECSANSKVCLFADDAKIYSTDSTDLQMSLNRISSFFRNRQLELAPQKCEFLRIGAQTNPHVFTIENNQIQTAHSVKDLGIHISQDLKWKTHVNKIASRAFQRCHQVLKSFSSRNVWTLLNAYTTFIRPTVEYATTIWNPYIEKDKKTVERVQKFFTKQICQRCNIPFDSYSDRLYKLDLKTLEYRRLEFDILMFYKFMNGLVDIKKSEFFTMSASRYNTRSHELCIRPNLINTNQLQHKFFINRCTSVWNNLPAELVKCQSYLLFRSKLKKFNLHQVAELTDFD